MRRTLLSLLPLLLYASLHAQPLFDPVELQNISNNKVMAFAQDDEGYLWIGTRHGLNRYNGNSYKKYYQGDSLSLASDRVEVLLGDSDNRIWVGSYSGIELIQDSKVVSRVRPAYSPIYALAHYDKERLLASTGDGIELYDKRSGEYRVVLYDPRILQSYFLLPTSGGEVWVAGYGKTKSVLVLDSDFLITKEILLPKDVNITGLTETSSGSVAVSSDGGLFLISTDNYRLLPIPDRLADIIGDNIVLFAQTDCQTGNTYVGIANSGIYSTDFRPQRLTRIGTQEKLTGCERCICYITQYNLLISKDFNGFSILPVDTPIESIPLNRMASDESVSAILLADDGKLQVFTTERVFIIDLDDKIPVNATPSLLSGQIVSSVFNEAGVTWLGMRDKVMRCTTSLEPLVSYLTTERKSFWGDGEGGIMVMCEEGILHIDRNGLQKWLSRKDYSRIFKCTKLDDGEVYCMSSDSVWRLGGTYDLEPLPLSIPLPTTVVKDGNGMLWVGSFSKGLMVYCPSTGEQRSMSTDDGLPDNSIRQLHPEKDGMIICARDKVAKLVMDGIDVSSIEISPAIDREFMSSSLILEDGRIALSAADRIILYNGHHGQTRRKIRMEFDGLTVNNRFNDAPEQHHAYRHDERTFRFYFSGADSMLGGPLNYEYMLLGFDKDWVYSGQVHGASYSNLKGGHYTFLARVTPSDTRAESNVLSYSFRVKPSPWLSWSAILIYLILLGVASWHFAKLAISNRQHKAQIERTEQERILISRVNNDKMNFFTNVSHEFRTPLTLIYGPIKELAGRNLDCKDKELVDIIDNNTGRMVHLVDQLLAFNKSYYDKSKLSVMRTNISQRLGALLDDFSYLFENKNITLSREVKGNIVGWCDSEKLERIVFNLISNAAKYTPDGGKVCVSLAVEGSLALLEVADTGIGIPDKEKERIFGRFERISSMNVDPGGFGIGLNFARELAHIHKGDISVRDNIPRGSIFSYEFPLGMDAYSDVEIWYTEEEPPSGLDTDAIAPVVRRNDHLVLVVEDNADMRHYLADMLREEYDVVTACDGLKALDKIKDVVPDMVISDVMMTGLDGIDLLEHLKNDDEYCHIPVVLLTAKADMDSRLQGLGRGADAYISKPFEKKYLSTIIKGILDNRRRIQKLFVDKTSVEAAKEEPALSPKDKAFVDGLYSYLERHAKEETLTITEICAYLGMSRTSVWSKIQTFFGVSPQVLILNFRLNRAMQLLHEGGMNVSEVAYSVGFGSLGGFSRAFKAKFGVTPSSVRKEE